MNIALWITQGLLGLAFLAAGIMKMSRPIAELRERMDWVDALPAPVAVRIIGLLEVAGGLGVVLPGALHIAPWLTAAAAVGLALIMVSALALHLVRHEQGRAAVPVVFLLLTLFVAYGRLALVF